MEKENLKERKEREDERGVRWKRREGDVGRRRGRKEREGLRIGNWVSLRQEGEEGKGERVREKGRVRERGRSSVNKE